MGLAASKQDYPSYLRALVEREIAPDDDQFWDAFWSMPGSVEDIFNSVKPDDVRRMKQQHPRNLAILLNKVVKRMRQVVGSGSKNTASDYKAALNCVRLVTRLLPFITEDQSDDFLEAVFWRSELPVTAAAPAPAENSTSADAAAAEAPAESSAAQPQSGDNQPTTDAVAAVEPAATSQSPTYEPAAGVLADALLFKGEDPTDPLAIRLLNAIVNLLFYPNFTVSPLNQVPAESAETFPLEHVWEPGVGVQDTLPTAAHMHSNRTEVLRCFLVLFSEALYRTPEETGKYVNKWLDIVACNTSYHSLAIFYSLLNTALSYDPVGWGMPYNHVIFTDSREGLADTSLQVLAVLLNHEPSTLIMRPGGARNIFVEYLKTVDQVREYEWIYEAMHQLLSNPIRAHNTYLPNSTKQVSCHQEVLMLFWKLIQENQGFFRWLLTKGDVTKVLDPILHYLHEGRKDITQRGLILLGTFALLHLSSKREFGVQLNKPFVRRVTIDLPTFTGNYADYLILVFHKMIVDGHAELEILYECWLSILANVSPFVKAVGMVTSNKLMHLFKLLSRPRFLFANERNHRYIFFLLNVFNNFIQYQYEGNYQLIYAMIRYREGFSSLARIDLSALQPKTAAAAATAPAAPLAAVTDGTSMEASGELPAAQEKMAELNISKELQPIEEQSPAAATTAVPGASVFPREHDTQPPAVVPAETVTTPAPSNEEVSSAMTTPAPEAAAAADSADGAPATTVQPAAGADGAFVPTAEWIESWRASLPIVPIIRLLAAIVPQIPALVSGSSADEAQILEYLRNTTLVGLLPVPHPILLRRYQSNAVAKMWFTTFMWGVIYLRNVNPPLFYATRVKLITVKMVDTPAP